MEGPIKGEMLIQDIIQRYPQTLQVFREYRLECMNCQIAQFEEVAHGASVHHLDPETLIEKLNEAINKDS